MTPDYNSKPRPGKVLDDRLDSIISLICAVLGVGCVVVLLLPLPMNHSTAEHPATMIAILIGIASVVLLFFAAFFGVRGSRSFSRWASVLGVVSAIASLVGYVVAIMGLVLSRTRG